MAKLATENSKNSQTVPNTLNLHLADSAEGVSSSGSSVPPSSPTVVPLVSHLRLEGNGTAN